MRVTINSLLDGRPVEVFPGLFVYTPPTQAIYNDEHPTESVIMDAVPNSLSVPHAGFGWSILEDSFLDEAIRVFGLQRLEGVCQLGFLEDPDTTSDGRIFQNRFTHTRLLHSLDVAALAALIVYNNRAFFERHPGHAATVVLAGLTHDAETPAGGDGTKSIDFAAFDEDVHFPNALTRPGVAEFLQRCQIDPELLCATVRNEGPLGSILDLADKLAYTARDTINFDGSRDTYRVPWDWQSPSRVETSAWTSSDQFIGLWQSVEVDESGVVVTDPYRLYTFSHTRALMFSRLYTAPSARHHESLFARTVLSYLYDTGRITRDWLLTVTDVALRPRACELLGHDFIEHLEGFRSDYQTYSTEAEARAHEGSQLVDGHPFVQTEDVRRFFKPATHFRIRTSQGVLPFHDSAPELAGKVVAAGQAWSPIRTYAIEGRQPTLPLAWADEFREWRVDKFHQETART